MKKSATAIAVAILLAAMSGCSSFKIGGACYIPYGVTGACTVDTTAPGK